MWSTKRLALSAAVGAALALGGCATSRAPTAGARLDAPTPLDQFAITTHETPDQVALAVHGEGVTAAQRQALAGLVERWRDAGGGMVTVQAPNDTADVPTARAYADAAVSTLGVLGVPYDQVRVVGYAAGPQARPVVLASFNRVVAEGPDCKHIPWGNLTATGSNQPNPRFGCVVTANLAAQIAYPEDLLGRAPTEPGDAARRATVLAKYRDGKITASEKDDNASGAVSQKVK